MAKKVSSNPLIFIKARKEDYQTPSGSNRKIPKIFEDYDTQDHRDLLNSNLQGIYNNLAFDFELYEGVPAVIKMVLHEDALAKSHRPTSLIKKSDCKVVGVGDFGELFVSVLPDGINKLAYHIANPESDELKANLSAIKELSQLTIDDIAPHKDKSLLLKKIKEDDGLIKYRLFDYKDDEENALSLKHLNEAVKSWGKGKIKQIDYSPTHKIYQIEASSDQQIDFLISYLGTRSINTFSKFEILRCNSIPLRKVVATEYKKPDPQIKYPVVGVVDSGVNPADLCLKPWIVRTHKYVNDVNQDYSHGSFVSGLISNSHELNHQDSRFEIESAKIVDVAALEKNGIKEHELKTILEEVIPDSPDVKVWNLSLSSSIPCKDYEFSDLAVFLDALQEKHKVSIVLSAGNYTKTNVRGWPPEDLGESDRITTSADSVRALTVGSTAHTSVANSCVKSEEPSPFSRRGPGPAFLPKPELSHYGGNCTRAVKYQQTGVISLNGKGDIAEDIGTSFSAPHISALLANIRERLGDMDSRSLAHALLIHSAVLRSKSLTSEEFRYRGFGIPGSVEDIMSCFDHQATSIFEVDLVPRIEFVKDFPIPPSLRTPDGKTKGEFTVTLVYDPPLDSRYGAEYCRTNVDVSLGRYDVGEDGKPHHKLLIPLAPGDISDMYEKKRIEHGFKWSPVKIYSRVIPKGVQADNWRLKVDVMARAEHSPMLPQKAHVIVTIADPGEAAPIYTEFRAGAKAAGWNAVEMRVTERTRLRG